MADNLLISSLENAFQSLILSALGSGNNVYTGKASSNKKLPCVICSADGTALEEDPPHSGNFWVDVEIAVKATAATEPTAVQDPKLDDLAFAKSVFDLVTVDNLDQLLNAQGQNLTVFPTAFFFGARKAGQDELGGWVDIQPIKLYCCGRILPP